MGKKRQQDKSREEDLYGHTAGAIGGLVLVTGGLMAVKEKLGLPWPVAVLLVVAVLVGLGYVAWWGKTTVQRLWARKPADAPAVALGQEAPLEAAVPAHPELTVALSRAGAIGKDEVIRLDEVQTEHLAGVGIRYTFLMPQARTHEHVAARLGPIASMLGVTRLHLKLETSRQNERHVELLKLNDPPFSRTFPTPTRDEIRAFAGIPLGHGVTGDLAGVPTFDKASLLMAGMTQMGKTTLVNGIITCLLIAYGKDFDLYLLDGKLCGLTKFEKIAVRYEASDEPEVMESMLDDLLSRVDSRYVKLQDAIRARKSAPKFRPVFFIIDEAADFYTDNGTKESVTVVRRVEDKSRKLVAKALESGISTIMLTQRPANDAIPVKVRDQFLYRMCLYVASEGGAKVALGDSYFETVAPIHPSLLDSSIKGQAVLFTNGVSTLLRGFNFEDSFIWEIVDEVFDGRQKKTASAPGSPRQKVIELMRTKGVTNMTTAAVAELFDIVESNATEQGKQVKKLMGVPSVNRSWGRGYLLAHLEAAEIAGT